MSDHVYILKSLHERLLMLERGSIPLSPSHDLSKTTAFLKADLGEIHIDDVKYTQIKDGDDGDIIQAISPDDSKQNPYILKVYKYPFVNDEDRPTMDAIVKDQAQRELTALMLLKGHPNVATLLSTEVDTCVLHRNGVDYPGSVLIRQEYIQNAVSIDEVNFKIMGLVAESAKPDTHYHVDFNVRLRLMGYILGQIASVTKALRDHGIYHRDLDSCNVVMLVPELRLYLLDFARADMPNMENIEDILKRPSSEAMTIEKRARYRNMNNLIKGVYNPQSQAENVQDWVILHALVKDKFESSCNTFLFESYEDETSAVCELLDEAEQSLGTDCESLLPLADPPIKELEQHKHIHQKSRQSQYFFLDLLTDPIFSARALQIRRKP